MKPTISSLKISICLYIACALPASSQDYYACSYDIDCWHIPDALCNTAVPWCETLLLESYLDTYHNHIAFKRSSPYIYSSSESDRLKKDGRSPPQVAKNEAGYKQPTKHSYLADDLESKCFIGQIVFYN